MSAHARSVRTSLEDLHREHGRYLWGLCYRLVGCAADADDLVQETFVRALERPPADMERPWRPWLTRVALNLGRDLLRRRKRRHYVGPWLPSPIETGDEASPAAYEPELGSGATTEGRYDLLESVSMAFLLSLEVLSPKQRAVLLLRDVFDYSVAETAEAIDVSEADVKTTHHRARRAMADYDRNRCLPNRELQARTRDTLETLLGALASGDPSRAEHLLAEDVTALSDGGGEFFAARVPVVGRERVLRFYTKIAAQRLDRTRIAIRFLSGLPALVVETPSPPRGQAGRFVQQLILDSSGRVRAMYSVLATRKLTRVRFSG
jgi:RNA polymerase sigma-70 factor (ECF subfamily)